MHTGRWIGLGACLLALLLCTSAVAQDSKAETFQVDPTSNAAIPMADLEDRLRGATADDLAAIAADWQTALQDKVMEIAELSIQIRAATDEAAKSALLEAKNALEQQKIGLQDRFRAVYLALRDKGGDPAPFQAYYDAVSGIQIDTSDAGAATSVVVNWLKSPEGGIRWGKNIGFAILTLVIFWVLAGFAGRITGAGLKRTKLDVSEGLRRFFVGMVKKLVVLLGVVLALSMLEVDIGPFIAAIGVGGFVLGFALQETLGNFAAGILILMYRPFQIGHVVSAAGITGKVQDISLVSTQFLTPDNQTIVVPNGSVWGGVITNITGNATRRVDMVFGIGYGDDLAKAEKILTEIVTSHPKVLEDPEPVIKMNELADSSVNFVCRPWSKTADYWDVKFDVTRAVKERFDAEGISIPFPQRDVHLHQVSG